MLLAVVASGYLVRILPFSLPLPLVQIALGAVVAALSSHGVTLDPSIFFVLFLLGFLAFLGFAYLVAGAVSSSDLLPALVAVSV